MKISDYIVEYLIEKGITDVFGYPGGMVTHLMDSFSKYQDKIATHVNYNEQGAAMAACGYAQASGKCGVAYATSGPGATNLITGICNAYMDSIPTVFITGQVNSFEQKGELKVRQRGFQETDIVAMVKPTTKYAVRVNDATKIKYELDKAFYIAHEGRKGPVLLDIAMDVTRTEIELDSLLGYVDDLKNNISEWPDDVEKLISNSKRPVVLLGKGIDITTAQFEMLKQKMKRLHVPVVTSMVAVDLSVYYSNFYGFIGAYGDRCANFVVSKCDLLISVGARLDIRQVGVKRNNFAPTAKIVRIDIDKKELDYKVHSDEIGICTDAIIGLEKIIDIFSEQNKDYKGWLAVCDELKNKLNGIDEKKYNLFVEKFSELIPPKAIVTTDVGQNQIWIAQSFNVKDGQRILFSGGHGAMGYSLPAAIGACEYINRPVYSFNGDGGIQMNIQELQLISKEQLPVKVIIFNNNALGMIRHFQEMYFDSNYFLTTPQGGFSSPNFCKIADAYSIDYQCINDCSDIDDLETSMTNNKPMIIEVFINEATYVFPKLEYGKPNHDQDPLIDRALFEYLDKL